MPVIRHADQPAKKGYYSKIINRQIVSSVVGATSFVLWEQVIPLGGYIVPHYHEFEEALTFLCGSVQVTMGDEHHQVEAGTTVFIRPYLKHSILNRGDEPAKLMALLMSADAEVIYPDGLPEPVIWEDD